MSTGITREIPTSCGHDQKLLRSCFDIQSAQHDESTLKKHAHIVQQKAGRLFIENAVQCLDRRKNTIISA